MVSENEIQQQIDSYLKDENLELYDLNIVNFPNISKIEVFIYSVEDVNINITTRLNRQLNRLVEDLGFEKGSFDMIVSSPGIERKLKSFRHFELSIGELIKVKLFNPINDVNTFEGDLGSDSKQAIESLALDKGVAVESMYEALVSAFRSAYMRIPGAAEEARVTLNPDSGEVLIYAQELDNEGNVIEEWKVELDEDEFGRIAAQSFKQMMTTKIRDAKRATVLDAYIGREGELITGIVTQFDPRFNQTILDLQDAEAVIPSGERVPFERLERGNRVKALITEVREDAKGIPIIVSRSKAEFVQRMLELEVPELTDGTVELRAIAREAGSRTKIAVFSNDPNVDPKGACVGSRGNRVRQIVNELRGEKLDVVEWREDKVRFIKEALGPADIDEVEIDEDLKTARVVVKDSQLSLAIGKEGQNARLAAKLTGYKIDIEGLGDSPQIEESDEEESASKEEE